MNILTIFMMTFSIMMVAFIIKEMVDTIVGKIEAKRILEHGEEIIKQMEKEASEAR